MTNSSNNASWSTSRRGFLRGGLQLGALAAASSSVSARELGLGFGSSPKDDHVLVVIQLSGGNDGLNTVVPHRQDAYYRMRPAISLSRNSLHRLDDDHGLHPAMGAMGELFAEGRVAVVHGVGYPEADRSHFRSMQIWHTADPKTDFGGAASRPRSGWLGRMASQLQTGTGQIAMPALHLGNEDLPLSLATESGFTPTVRGENGFQLMEPSTTFVQDRDSLLDAGQASGSLAFLRGAAKSTYDAAARMEHIGKQSSSGDYPNRKLAKRLALCSKLIAGEFGTRLFGIVHGGFDTHALQKGNHEDLLRELSDSVAAFQRDLQARGVAKRVTTMIFSEFGRRAAENGSKGTDHGQAGPVFLVGSNVQGGLHGTAPDLDILANGDIPFTTDFRSIYTSLERDWMGLAASTKVVAASHLLD